MNEIVAKVSSIPELPVPAELKSLFEHPPHLIGENIETRNSLALALYRTLQPRDAMEWVLFLDLINVLWDVCWLPNAKASIINITRKAALRQILASLAEAGAEGPSADKLTEDWYDQGEGWGAVRAILGKHDLSVRDINAQALAMRMPELEIIQRWLERARAQMADFLRLLENYRASTLPRGHVKATNSNLPAVTPPANVA